MLEAELDALLDNEKHDKSKDSNYRNGYGIKKIKSFLVRVRLKSPRDGAGRFEPALVPKRHHLLKIIF